MVLDDNIRCELIAIAQSYDLDSLILFGSRAREDCFERSDIDLAASFKTSMQYFDFCDAVEKIRTPLMFDVVNLARDTVDLDLLKSIDTEGVLLYEKV